MRNLNVGDKVRVKSKEWYEKNKSEDGIVHIVLGFIEEMSSLCGHIVTIRSKVFDNTYAVEGSIYLWCEEFFENIHNQN